MVIIVDNIVCSIQTGGSDNLINVDVYDTLKKYLRVRVKGYSYSKQYRDRVWDGYKVYITKSLKFPTGFLEQVYKYLEDLGFTIEIVDNRKNLPKFSDAFINTIGDWILRDYQEDMVKCANRYLKLGNVSLYYPRGIWDAATNAGKTSAIAGLYNNLVGAKAIFLLSNRTAFDQMVEYFSTMYDVGQVKSGKVVFTDFTVAMCKTLYNKVVAKDLNVLKELSNVNTLFVDETHEAGSNTYNKLLSTINAGARFFVSGTPLDNDKTVNNLPIIGLSGKVIYRISNKDLIAKGVSMKPLIKVLLNWSGQGYLDYKKEYEKVVEFSENRLRLIFEIIEKHQDKQIMITFKNKEHGKFIYDRLLERFPYLQNECYYIHGESKIRSVAIEDFKRNKVQVLIASMILKQSINIPNIEVLVLAHGGKSKITVKQFVGRALRTDGKNTEVLIYDFFDMGKFVSKHSKKRLAIYRQEGFDLEFKYDATKLGTPRVKK